VRLCGGGAVIRGFLRGLIVCRQLGEGLSSFFFRRISSGPLTECERVRGKDHC